MATTQLNEALSSPFTVGSLTTRNRIAMAPMTRKKSPGGVPGPDVINYYVRRARAKVGLIITEGIFVTHPSAGFSTEVPRFDSEDARAGWRTLVRRVHDEGSAIAAQLWHAGVARPEGSGPAPEAPVISPSGISLDGSNQGRAMSHKDIDHVISAFASAAATAYELGFDAIEIHGAHGYLVDQFLWPQTNKRVDRYGGSSANRAAFGADLVRAIRAVVPNDYPVSLRISQWKMGHYGQHLAQTPRELEELLGPLVEAGVTMFHGSQRRFWLPEFEGSHLNLAGWIKKITAVPTVTVGSVGLDAELIGAQGSAQAARSTDLGDLEKRLAEGEFDLVAVGRALIADPEWATKALNGESRKAAPYSRSQLSRLI